jgi:hypothetical protein
MTRRSLLALASPALLSLLTLPAPTLAGPSIRCRAGLVSQGDARIDLLGKCGSPALEERRVDERWVVSSTRVDHRGEVSVGRRVFIVIDEWTYDLGTHDFIHVVTLENGRITGIVRRSWGYRADPPAAVVPPRALCQDLAGIREGDGKLEVLSRCGEPAVAEAWDEVQGVFASDARVGVAQGQDVTVRIETWTYDLGRNRLVRFVRFENGRVVRITTGSYGYAEES